MIFWYSNSIMFFRFPLGNIGRFWHGSCRTPFVSHACFLHVGRPGPLVLADLRVKEARPVGSLPRCSEVKHTTCGDGGFYIIQNHSQVQFIVLCTGAVPNWILSNQIIVLLRNGPLQQIPNWSKVIAESLVVSCCFDTTLTAPTQPEEWQLLCLCAELIRNNLQPGPPLVNHLSLGRLRFKFEYVWHEWSWYPQVVILEECWGTCNDD